MSTNYAVLLDWTQLAWEGWTLHIAAVSDGLCYVGSPNRPLEELAAWAASRLPGYKLARNDEKLRPYAEQIVKYLQGGSKSFTVPLALQGTPFQLSVWNALGSIPYGQTRSYSDIAQLIRRPAAVRAVGAAIGANPVLIAVPCHRVVGKNGALTGYRGGMEMKERLLRLEREGSFTSGNVQHV